MKFLLNTAFLASLALGVASSSEQGKQNHASNTDMEDFAYWRGLVDVVDSMPSTKAPTKSPSSSPVVSPTDAPVASIDPIRTAAPVIPAPAPVALVTPVPTPVTSLSPTPAPSSSSSCQTIAEVLVSTPEFTKLLFLVESAGLLDTLAVDNLTLLAPTNAAIEALPEELLSAVLADIDLLKYILFGHAIANQEILVEDLVCEGGTISTLTMANNEETAILCTSSTDTEGNVEVNTFIEGKGNTRLAPKIVGPDGVACNGIIQAIDGVILPEPEVPGTVAPVSDPTPPPVVAPTPIPVAPVSDPTPAPVSDPTPPPVAPVADLTAAPVVAPTPAPIAAIIPDPTAAPVVPTEAPVVPTEAPVVPTEAPVVPTEAPIVALPAIQEKLIPYALNGGTEFEDDSSYQSKALQQVQAQVGVDEFSDAKLTQYYVLYCIYFATNGVPNLITNADPRFEGIPFPNWLITTGWEETDVDPCDGGFYGIVCDSESRVSTIDLFDNLLTGAFPPEVVLLSLDGPFSAGGGNLYRLDMFRNEFLYNNADNSWMTDLGSNMTTIIVEETAFAGDIPRLPDFLVNFDISFSYFTGGLTDANFENLEKLSFVDLDGNAFNSTIPSVFGRLPNLEFLYLSDSFLSGDLSYMNGMSSIREHWVDTNPGLTGPIYDFIGDITTLESWSMTFNSVTGTLPSTLGNLQNMQQMWLYSNQLTGTIPGELGNLRNMAILQLEGNSFVGSMPAEVCANTVFPSEIIDTLGADCSDEGFECSCCTCCSVLECTA